LYRKLLHAKIHGATVTATTLEYEGSIGLDADLLRAAGISPMESVHVWNVSNGERFETYAIALPGGSGDVVINGAAARKAQTGDRVIITSFAWLTPNEMKNHTPVIVLVDERNRVKRKKR
jgi:aspartate 1-decarboxylase